MQLAAARGGCAGILAAVGVPAGFATAGSGQTERAPVAGGGRAPVQRSKTLGGASAAKAAVAPAPRRRTVGSIVTLGAPAAVPAAWAAISAAAAEVGGSGADGAALAEGASARRGKGLLSVRRLQLPHLRNQELVL